jgi:hypothetical protein
MDAYQELVRELYADSEGFVERGRGYTLLQHFFSGEPIESLRELLRSSDVFVQRTAVFVASELGSLARPLLADVCPLLRSRDRHVKFNAIEVIAVCAIDDDAYCYAYIVTYLEDADKALRQLVMYLMSRAERSVLARAHDAIRSARASTDSHILGLNMLISDMINPQEIGKLLFDRDIALRSYAAIAVRRSIDKWPELVNLVKASDDPVLSEFAAQF